MESDSFPICVIWNLGFADVTSGTFTVNMTENLSVFGSVNESSTGYGLKRPGGGTHDYIVDKVSIGLTPEGPTITYRQEGVNVQLKNEGNLNNCL